MWVHIKDQEETVSEEAILRWDHPFGEEDLGEET